MIDNHWEDYPEPKPHPDYKFWLMVGIWLVCTAGMFIGIYFWSVNPK